MNGSVNKVILVGNLGKDPEIRKLESGNLMARFSMATSEHYTDKTSGKKLKILIGMMLSYGEDWRKSPKNFKKKRHEGVHRR